MGRNKKENPKKADNGHHIIKTLVAIFILIGVSVGIAFGVIIGAKDIFGIDKPDHQIEVSITSGSSVNEIAKTLEKSNVIEYRSLFLIYSTIRGQGDSYKAGEYIMNSKMSYDEIMKTMRTGDTIKDVVTITFYEGMSMREIANSLEKEGVCDSQQFIDTLQNTDFGYEFEEMIPSSPLRFRKLEGYLFPDTYQFYVGENPVSVAKKFLKNFQNKVFPELYEEIKAAGMTLDEAITLASIIQEEASLEAEMYNVSAIFHNRMNLPSVYPKLESDVTIFYVEKDIKPFQTRSTQDMYDAYNTYVCKGLPVAPICSPGLAAIKSAVRPNETEYYFFVTDAKGTYYYSKTVKEHNINVRAAAKVKK